MKKPKIIAVIPAHLASLRFPRKILFPFFDIPMIEHVRRRALLSSNVSEVIVATCDHEIASVIEGFGGKVVFLPVITTETAQPVLQKQSLVTIAAM